MKDIDEIVGRLEKARDAYYNSDSPIMSDEEFDKLEEELRSRDPNNHYFQKVGAPTRGKIRHEIPMLSMQKGKSVDEIFKWMDKLGLPGSTQYCIMPKIDGLSATCRFEDGRLQYVATRGNGQTGQDVSHIVRYVPNIADFIDFTRERIEIRGELYLPKNTGFDTGGRPLRNNCVGLVNRKEKNGDLRYVRFAAFQITGNSEHRMETDVADILENTDFEPVPMFATSSRDEIVYYWRRYLRELRTDWDFETDGLVISLNDRSLFSEIDSRWVVDHHHHYVIALKPPPESVETILRKIDWQVSRQGNVVPVAVFEPVKIGGATIERASLSNYENILKMDIHLGDTLLIERANDVIPYIRENISASSSRKSDPVSIATCPSCSSDLTRSGVHMRCLNPECPEINIQRIIYWIKSSGIEQIGEETVRFLYSKGIISSISDLYSLKEEELASLEGFAEKKSSSIVQEIQNSKEMDAVEFISKLGIPMVQKKALQKLNITSLDDFYEFDDPTYVIGQNIIEWKKNKNNISFMAQLLETCDITDYREKKKGIVCMTGSGPKTRSELADDIAQRGYEFSENLTQDTDILLTDNPEGSSSKLEKARKYSTRIMTYDDFFSQR